MGDHAIGHALVADQSGEGAGVDAGEADDAARLQPFVEMAARAVVGGLGHRRLDDATHNTGGGREVGGFDILVIGADIADMRESESDDLAGIGRVGQHLLIAGHGGVEAHLAHRLALGAESLALDHRAIGQHH